MFQIESTRTMELECVFVSAMVLRGRSSIFDSISFQVSVALTTTIQWWSWLILIEKNDTNGLGYVGEFRYTRQAL